MSVVSARKLNLSVRASAFLEANALPTASIQDSVEKTSAFLASNGCQQCKAFIEYFLHYAGLTFSLPTNTGSQLRFRTTENGASVFWDAQSCEFQLFFGEVSDSHLAYWLRPDGSVILKFFSGKEYRLSISSSINIFLEDLAMKWWANNNNYSTDDISTSFNTGAASLAEMLNLSPVTSATDAHIQWWMDNSVCVGNYPLLNQRFWLTVYWKPDRAEIEHLVSRKLADLLERHLRAVKELPEWRDLRRSNDLAAAIRSGKFTFPLSPAQSFRIAAQEGLVRLVGAEAFPPDFNEEARLYTAFQSQLASNKRAGNTIGIYFAAVGLFAFGRIEMFETILKCMPQGTHSAWGSPLWAATFLGFLLPVSFQFSPTTETLQSLQWFHANKNLLEWNAENERYQFRNHLALQSANGDTAPESGG